MIKVLEADWNLKWNYTILSQKMILYYHIFLNLHVMAHEKWKNKTKQNSSVG